MKDCTEGQIKESQLMAEEGIFTKEKRGLRALISMPR